MTVTVNFDSIASPATGGGHAGIGRRRAVVRAGGERELRDLELVPLRAGAVEHKELEDAAAPRVEGEWHALRLVHGDGAQRLLASAMGVDELRLACAAAPASAAKLKSGCCGVPGVPGPSVLAPADSAPAPGNIIFFSGFF